VLTQGELDLTAHDYELFRTLIYEKSGINLGDKKQQLLRARLGKRLRGSGFESYRAYYEHVRNDSSGAELCALIDAVSTNTTHLFREKLHFDFLAKTLLQQLDDRRWRAANSTLRVWSAGCSTGDESYSLAMTVDNTLAQTGLDWRILATDISTRVLEKARAGVYESHRLGTVPPEFRVRYFVPADAAVQVCPALRKRITFAQFNLMSPRFPFRHGFHYIFCRNVMIYFDRPTQQRLVAQFAAQLQPGGHLLIGHSESLNAIQHPLEYVQPTIYRKPNP
jgi:chemotaxis protein methyltransferase CheR